MATNIKCPSCSFVFPLEESLSEDYKKDLREKMNEYTRKKDEEYSKREQFLKQQLDAKDLEYGKQLQIEKNKIQQQLEEQIRKAVSSDYETQLSLLKQNSRDQEEKLKLAREKELEFLQKEQQLKNREAELELDVHRKLQAEREKLTEELRKQEEEKSQVKETENKLRMKELEKQLEDQKKLVDEMKRKAEQGSMQLQGEVQELALEEMLKSSFPFDLVEEVGKGIRGADCILVVRNSMAVECGRIIFESKRTKDFSRDWAEKLKTDMRSLGADIAVLVSATMPKDMNSFGEKDGVWICNFDEVRALVHVLRDGILRVATVRKAQENKGDKMVLLYNYLTSKEFGEQWKAIYEVFMSIRVSIQKERDMMERIWKAREKQLEKALLNTQYIRGSVEGIAGQDSINLELPWDSEADTLTSG
ncbi:DUF2130 domain-containing protein [Pollutibacter soli]|uniref:DUF2130 domain-containing protein n=1 Tax=Pollutibacter soli TaxID=3034157 RepID=UPI0030137B54